MRKFGYDKKFAYGICSSGGVIGMLIPPSVLIVIYGLLSRDSIGSLLIAGISPGILLFVIFSLGITLMVYLNPSLASRGLGEKVNWRQRLGSLKLVWGVFVILVIIFGGIFSGVFSPSEAGAVACVILLVIFIFSRYRSWDGLKTAIYDTIAPSGMIFLLLIGAGIFTRFLVLSTLAPKFLNAIIALNLPTWGFLAGVVVVYLLLGCFFDSISMLSITLPFLHPAAQKLGIDPIHFAMVAILAIEMGFITPPVGLNIYAVKGVAESDVSLGELFVGVMPFFLMMGFCVILFIGFPALSTWLPGMMFR
jgi:tripartite ATP-independent transporter DctM subunit